MVRTCYFTIIIFSLNLYTIMKEKRRLMGQEVAMITGSVLFIAMLVVAILML